MPSSKGYTPRNVFVHETNEIHEQLLTACHPACMKYFDRRLIYINGVHVPRLDKQFLGDLSN